MKHEILIKPLVLLAFILVFQSSYGQDTIPTPVLPDSVQIDSIFIDSVALKRKIDTIVIRRVQERIKERAESVNLFNTNISFKKTKPLDQQYKKFNVPTFWQSVNLIGLNFSQAAFVNWNAGGNNSISALANACLLYTSPSPRDRQKSRMPSSA